MRLSFIIQFVFLIVIGCGVYNVANHYQIIERKVSRLNAQSEQERENIRVLQAEWAFLTNPERLEKISAANLSLQAVDGSQLVAVAQIPMRATLDAQEVETNLADNSSSKIAPPLAELPANVIAVPVAAVAMPSPAGQALPPLEAIQVSASGGMNE